MSARKKAGKSSGKAAPSSLKTPLLDVDSFDQEKEDTYKSSQTVPTDTPSTILENVIKNSTQDNGALSSRTNALCDAAASDLYEHKPTVTFADQNFPSGKKISIPALLAKIPKGKGGTRQLKSGGIEAIPVISGEDVKVVFLIFACISSLSMP
jgi:hypothetical protein